MERNEREILIKRFFYEDRSLHKLGKVLEIGWFNQFNNKFEKDKYAFFSSEEKLDAIKRITSIEIGDNRFVSALNKIEIDKYIEIDRFVGEKYFFAGKKENIFKIEDQRKSLIKNVKESLKDTKNRAYFFLMAIIQIYNEDRWDKAYRGATWIDVLAKIRELGGIYPAPRDIPILKSYRIYYKTGSRRYPTHTIPEEMIPTIKNELEKHNINK